MPFLGLQTLTKSLKTNTLVAGFYGAKIYATTSGFLGHICTMKVKKLLDYVMQDLLQYMTNIHIR